MSSFKLVKSPFDCTTDVVLINDRGEDSTIVEVSVELYGENPITIDEFHFRWKTNPDDPGARWIPRERAEDFVGKKGIAAGMRNVRFQVKQKNSYIEDAKDNPLHGQMTALVDKYVEHYHSDFTIYDCETLGRGADHFIWMVRECGTWLIRCQCNFNDDLIRAAVKDPRIIPFLAKDGKVQRVKNASLMELYHSFKDMRVSEVEVPA